jgi:hypothetical protein
MVASDINDGVVVVLCCCHTAFFNASIVTKRGVLANIFIISPV